MTHSFSIRILAAAVLVAMAAPGALAQQIAWTALTAFQEGTCRNAIHDMNGNLFISSPVTRGDGFRSIYRFNPTLGTIEDLHFTSAVIRGFDSTAGQRLFCATEDGLFYSDNSGTAWTRDWQLGTQPTMLVRCLRGSTYALTFNGAFYRYDDAQSSWQQRGTIEQFNPTNLPLNYRAAYELVQDQAGRLYLHQREGSTFDRRMQISDDDGQSWIRLKDTLATSSATVNEPQCVFASPARSGVLIGDPDVLLYGLAGGMSVDTVAGVDGYITSIVQNAGGTLFLGLGAGPWMDATDTTANYGIMQSVDGGSTWSPVLDNVPVQYLAMMKDGRLLVSSRREGLFYFDPVTKNRVPLSLSFGCVTDIRTTADGTVCAVTDSAFTLAVWRSSDNGTTWGIHETGIQSYWVSRPRILIDRQNDLFVGGSSWAFSTDGGSTFSTRNWNFVVAVPTAAGEWIGIGSSAWQNMTEASFSTDGGVTWEYGPDIPYICNGWNDLVFDAEEVHPGAVLAAGRAGLALRTGGHGASWTHVGTWRPTDISRTGDGTVYVGTRDTTFSFIRSGDHGASWTAYAIGDSLAAHAAVHADGGLLLAVGSRYGLTGSIEPDAGMGLLFSSDLVNWSAAGAPGGLPTDQITCLARDSAGYIYAGTQGLGIYRSTDPVSPAGPTVLSAESPRPVVTAFTFEVFPQPATTRVSIFCRMPARGELTLRIHDVLGRRAATEVLRQSLSEGTHQLSFDIPALPAGVYLLVGSSGGVRVTKQLTIIR